MGFVAPPAFDGCLIDRLAGLTVLLIPVDAVVVRMVAPAAGGASVVLLATAYAAVLGAWTMALAPWTGATVAGTIGVFFAWVGQVPLDRGFTSFGSGLGEVVRVFWVVAPMSWRVEAGWRDGLGAATLVTWLVLSTVLAAASVRLRTFVADRRYERRSM